jgi:hypothetical protein
MVCHARDTPRLTECRCSFMFERKMRESRQSAMARSVHIRNERDSMAPVTAGNSSRTVTRWRGRWLNHANPLQRSPLSLAVAAAVVATVAAPEKSADSASRRVGAVALVDEGGAAPPPHSFCPAGAKTGRPSRAWHEIEKGWLGDEALRVFGRSETQYSSETPIGYGLRQ